MSNLTDLKALYLAKGAAYITDDIQLAEFNVAVDDWYNNKLAIDSLSATDIASYSIAGRTVTRQQLPQLRADAARLLAELRSVLYDGNGGRVDMSGAEDNLAC